MLQSKAHLDFQTQMQAICDASTSADAQLWTKENPLYAHCAVVALLAQDTFGGDLLRASLLPYPEFAHLRSHYWNIFPDGSEVDFTEPQFCGRRPTLLGLPRSRAEVLGVKNFDTVMRYNELVLRLVRVRATADQPLP